MNDLWVLQYRYRDDYEWFQHAVSYHNQGKPLSEILKALRGPFREGRNNPLVNTKTYAHQLYNLVTGEVIPWEALGE